MRRTCCVLALLLGFALCAAPATPAAGADATTHPFTVHDLLAMDRVSDPQVSPDGRHVVFVVRTTDLEANRGRTDLWLLDLAADGTAAGAARRLTTHEAGDFNPRWTPDGRAVLFLSTRSGSSQVWKIPMAGGEARQVTDLPLDVGNLVVSPDGVRLAFTLDVFPDCAELSCTVERLERREEDPASGRVYTDLLIRHWDAWDDDRRSHLFTWAWKEEGAEPVDLTAGMDADVPSQPFGGTEDVTFSPDGAAVVFVSRDVGAAEAWSTNFDLFHAPADGSGEPTNLTADNEAWDSTPAFSPDGRHFAWLAMIRPGFESDRRRILVRSVGEGGRPTGEARELHESWDRSPESLLWAPDGGTLYVTAANVGQVSLFAVDVESGEGSKVLWYGHVRSPQVLPVADGHRLLVGMDSLTAPVELYSLDPATRDPEPVQLTHVNREQLAAVEMGEPEQFHFEGWNGERVWGYVVKPAGFEEGERYPVAFLIHGGPQGSFGNDFHYRWNPQVYAGAGYGAVMIDFHGSVGYGQDFVDSIRDDWGGKPLEDLQKGLAAALERYPWLDGERACALGASYGGYMINWIAGNWPDRFDCLVNHDGLFDNRMMYYTTEELWFPEWEHMGTYFENPDAHEAQNPVNHVEEWRTPMLVIHGALDFRVPETQAFATFTALRRRGIPAKLLYLPDENHFVLQPANSILWHDTVLDWLGRWTAPE